MAATSLSPWKTAMCFGSQPVRPPTQPVSSSASSHAWLSMGLSGPTSWSHAAAGMWLSAGRWTRLRSESSCMRVDKVCGSREEER